MLYYNESALFHNLSSIPFRDAVFFLSRMYLWSVECLVFLVMWHHKVIMAMALDYVV